MNDKLINKRKDIIDLLLTHKLDYYYDFDVIENLVGKEYQEHFLSACKIVLFNNERKETKQNYELISDYTKFLKKVEELIDFLNIGQNDLEKAILLEYLIHKGYLSYNNRFKLANTTDKMPHHNGINIILGKGVCRHIANFYNDLFNYSYPMTFAGVLTKKNIPVSLLKYRLSNHIINITKYNDQFLGIDLTNKIIFNFINPFQLQNFNNHIFLTWTSHYDVFRTYLSHEEIENKLRDYEKSLQYPPLTEEEYHEIKSNILNQIYQKKKIIESFSMETNPLKREIKEKMLLKR